jgi:hypothetical protein
MGMLEQAGAKRLRAAHLREIARNFKRLSDRLLALESAVELEREAAMLDARAAEQIEEDLLPV